jgi:DNA-directed RNA polymerase subunit RPC12/RpoP
MSYTDVIREIEGLQHYRNYRCATCGYAQDAYALNIQSTCQNCGSRHKLRGHGAIGTEIEDVIDAVLEWIGKGNEFDLAMSRKKELDLE